MKPSDFSLELRFLDAPLHFFFNFQWPLCAHNRMVEIFLSTMKTDCIIIGKKKGSKDERCSISNCLVVGLQARQIYELAYSPQELVFKDLDCGTGKYSLQAHNLISQACFLTRSSTPRAESFNGWREKIFPDN